jgi:hypothetical protein
MKGILHRLIRTSPAVTGIAFAALLSWGAGLGGCAPTLELSTRNPDAPRIVAFGDVHGDLSAARRALRLAGAIDENDRWIGGNLVVVQTGDQLDRGDEERAILNLFERLARDAARAGGAFHALNGNHELMNVQLDLRYVTEGGYADFAGDVRRSPARDSLLLAHFPPGQRGRVAAFRPGGPYARMLANRNTILVVGGNVFVHGGVLPEHAEYGIERINEEIRLWLLGAAPEPAWVTGADSPTWTRLYSREPDANACATLDETLRLLGAQRMIVGHTPHLDGPTAYCDGRVWVVDTGMAAYYRGTTAVLEIRGDQVRPIR